MKYTWVNPYHTVISGYVLKVNQILIDDEIVQTYPTNDGGYWYMHKGKVVVVNE